MKYNEKFTAIAEDLATNGESDERIAFLLQISMPTFYNYKAQFPEFAEALVVGRKVCYSRVRAKLLKLALGALHRHHRSLQRRRVIQSANCRPI